MKTADPAIVSPARSAIVVAGIVAVVAVWLAYPLGVAAVEHVAFPQPAREATVTPSGGTVPVALTGNLGDDARYFQARPSSSGGIDQQLSVSDAERQAHRVAAARGVPLAAVRRLVGHNTTEVFVAGCGACGVSVLELNLALDRSRPSGARATHARPVPRWS